MLSMKKSFYLSFIFAAAWLLIKVIFYYLGDSETGFNVGVSTNLIFILAIVSIILWNKYRNMATKRDLISDVKDTTKPALLYVILMVTALTAYYSFLDTHFLPNRKNLRYDMEVQKIKSDADYAKMQKNDIRLEKVSKAEYLKNIKRGFDEQYTVKRIAFGGFIIFTIASFIYSFILSFLFRNFLFK